MSAPKSMKLKHVRYKKKHTFQRVCDSLFKRVCGILCGTLWVRRMAPKPKSWWLPNQRVCVIFSVVCTQSKNGVIVCDSGLVTWVYVCVCVHGCPCVCCISNWPARHSEKLAISIRAPFYERCVLSFSFVSTSSASLKVAVKSPPLTTPLQCVSESLPCPGLFPWSLSKTLPVICMNPSSEPRDCSGLVHWCQVAACARLNASGSRNVHTPCSHRVGVLLSPQVQDFLNCPQAQCTTSQATCMHMCFQRCFRFQSSMITADSSTPFLLRVYFCPLVWCEVL